MTIAGSPIAGAPLGGSFTATPSIASAVSALGTAWLDEMLAEYWTAATVAAYLLADGTDFDPDVDHFLADIPVEDHLTIVLVNGKANLDGYFTSDPIVMTLGSGQTPQWLVIVRIDGTPETSPIIGATDVMADDIPLNSEPSNGNPYEFDTQALGLGRI